MQSLIQNSEIMFNIYLRDVVKPHLDNCVLYGGCASERGKDWRGRGGVNKGNNHKSEKRRQVKKGWKSLRSEENTAVGGCVTVCKHIKDHYRKRTGANYSH